MKESRLLRGWKELTSKLHPQLPLDHKESQRLLTALTSSFRQHLDEVHPPNATDGSKPTLQAGKERFVSSAVHASSATHADNHIASVLTSPLLSRAETHVLDSSTAREQLLTRLDIDPLDLLEQYQRVGAANLEVAQVCIVETRRRLNSLSDVEQQALMRSTQPGQRLLRWLFDTKSIRTAAFAERAKLVQLMVSSLIREGAEGQLWGLLKLDLCDASTSSTDQPGKPPKRFLERNSWKGAVVQAIMRAVLAAEPFGPANANAAISAYLDMHEMEKEASERGIKLASGHNIALQLLYSDIRRRPQGYLGVDNSIYDRFLTAMLTNFHGTKETSMKRFRHDMMLLQHPDPSKATAVPAFKLLQRLFSLESEIEDSAYWKSLVQQVFNPPGPSISKAMFNSMCAVATRLHLEGRSVDAEWLQQKIFDQYPQHRSLMEERLRKSPLAIPRDDSARASHPIEEAMFAPVIG